MTKEDRQLIEDAKETEAELHQAILARVSTEVANMLEVYERMATIRLMVIGERLPETRDFKTSEGFLALRRDVGKAHELLG